MLESVIVSLDGRNDLAFEIGKKSGVNIDPIN